MSRSVKMGLPNAYKALNTDYDATGMPLTALKSNKTQRHYRWDAAGRLLSIVKLTAKAIDYTLRRWAALTVHLQDARIPIDNNAVENAIRPIALGRKNWLFVGSQQAGERAAALISLIESAKLNGHEAWAYLRDILTKLPTWPNSRLEELLPHRWQPPATALSYISRSVNTGWPNAYALLGLGGAQNYAAVTLASFAGADRACCGAVSHQAVGAVQHASWPSGHWHGYFDCDQAVGHRAGCTPVSAYRACANAVCLVCPVVSALESLERPPNGLHSRVSHVANAATHPTRCA